MSHPDAPADCEGEDAPARRSPDGAPDDHPAHAPQSPSGIALAGPPDILLDARRLLCPLPVIRTQRQVDAMRRGSVLDVLATDPGVLQDIPAWCRVHGHEYLGAERIGREIRCRLRVRHGRA